VEIIELELNKIKPYAKNAKTHPEDQVQLIANSIKEFGFKTPIVVDENLVIIQGHGRRLASQSLGLKTIPCVIADDLSKEQVKMLRLADNKVAESEWDIETLDMELSELNDLFTLDDFGFDFEMPNDYDENEADIVPELEENPCIKRGDLIELSNHRLLCGDSTYEADVEKLMNGKKADMVFTDPPYGVDFQSNMRTKSKKFEVLKNDDIFLTEWIPFINKYSKGFVFVWTSWKVVNKWIDICKSIGDMSNMIIWFKGGGGIGDLKRTFLSDYEIALVYHRCADIQDKRLGSVWQVSKDGVNDYAHPTQKPVELMEKGIFNCSKTKNIVMDLFLGSGSTLIACENLTRKCYGMELDEKYAQVIIQRWCDYTSIDTIKINGEEVSWSEYKDNALAEMPSD